MSTFAVILPAAGSSSRFGTNKLAAEISGRTVLQRSLAAFLHRQDVSHVIIAASDFAAVHDALVRPPFSPALLANPKLNFCNGGASRAQSVALALAAVPGDVEWVAVHDAARPLVSQALIDRTLAAAQEHGAAAPALAVAYTIKRADAPLPAAVRQTMPRHDLWAMQTPQVMRRADLAKAIQTCPIPLEKVTDDVQFLELAGKPVWLVEGEEINLKITRPIDLKIAELMLAELRQSGGDSQEITFESIVGRAPVAQSDLDVT
jgi:2-C-methyl-D-erythritol 4-phosphate cytidylyltransferase